MAGFEPSIGGSGEDDPNDLARHIDRIRTDPEEAHYDLLDVVADLEGCDAADLPPLYDRVDHLIEHLFTSPPDPKAQAQVEFTYFEYRVMIDQSGHVALRKQVERLDVD